MTSQVIEKATSLSQTLAAERVPASSQEIALETFPLHDIETAPEASRKPMQALASALGSLPNIAKVMAASPVLIGGLVGLFGQVHGGSFSEAQIQVLLLTDAVVNEAEWAVAFHTRLALEHGLPQAEVDAIRAGRLPAYPEHAALSALARALIERRGRIDAAQQAAFLDAGFTAEHLLELVAVVAASTITNYTASICRPPLEPALAPYAWR